MAKRFVTPPNWPTPPEGFVPPEGWEPEPLWGPAPQGWEFWVDDATPAVSSNTRQPPKNRHSSRIIFYFLIAAFVVAVIAAATTGVLGGKSDSSSSSASTGPGATPETALDGEDFSMTFTADADAETCAGESVYFELGEVDWDVTEELTEQYVPEPYEGSVYARLPITVRFHSSTDSYSRFYPSKLDIDYLPFDPERDYAIPDTHLTRVDDFYEYGYLETGEHYSGFITFEIPEEYVDDGVWEISFCSGISDPVYVQPDNG